MDKAWDASEFNEAIFLHGIATESPAPGILYWSRQFHGVVNGLVQLISTIKNDAEYEVMRLPPVMARADFEMNGYLYHFPHLAGTIHSFTGGEAEHNHLLQRLADGEDWTLDQIATDLVMTPACCYPLYPLLSRRAPLSNDGFRGDLLSYCFRREASTEPGRMQSFRMQEFVRISEAEEVERFLIDWKKQTIALMEKLGLQGELVLANDAFFGRKGKMTARNQRDERSKYELLLPICGSEATACASFNYHAHTFVQKWGIRMEGVAQPHSGCAAYGLERLALALYARHGVAYEDWPESIRSALGGMEIALDETL